MMVLVLLVALFFFIHYFFASLSAHTSAVLPSCWGSVSKIFPLT